MLVDLHNQEDEIIQMEHKIEEDNDNSFAKINLQ